ncbi:MAG: DNA topoisomerase IV subunit B, partial [Actinomycetales bacterium]|nr:DNA topoisomerase IV subunit B [Actinomycetales bacterium]
MYIGSTDSRGLMHCLWEIIDNSVDESLSGHGNSIDVILHADASVEVHDKARGIPVDIEPKTGLSGVEVVFTKLHAGGKFGSGSYAASGGLHGVGASVVNALSERLDVEVDRDSKTWAMSFRRGEPGTFDDSKGLSPTSPFTPFSSESVLRVVGKVAKGVTGTRVRYWADSQIFTPGASFQAEELANRARQTAFLVPGLTMHISDQRSSEHLESSYNYTGGISEFVEYLAPDAAITETWRLTGDGEFTETVPVLGPDGSMALQTVQRSCHVDIALRWGTGYDTTMQSFVNIIATPKGGTHQAGFDQALLKVIRAQVEANSRK